MPSDPNAKPPVGSSQDGTGAKPRRERVDKLVVERGLAETRNRAQALIMAGQVVVDDHTVDKAGARVSVEARIRLKGGVDPFASRAGGKLEGALVAFEARGEGVPVAGRVAMDVGASTGGFTDCLLRRGAARVYAVDVGYGQLISRLARDERVVVLDRTNIRHLAPEAVPDPIELCVADCSFISLRKVLPALPPFLAPGAHLVALVKPQFEVGPDAVGKGGIVRDDEARTDAVEGVRQAALALGFGFRGQSDSTVVGRSGNREALLWLQWEGAAPAGA